MENEIKLKESGIPQTIRIQNSISSTVKDWNHVNSWSGIQNPRLSFIPLHDTNKKMTCSKRRLDIRSQKWVFYVNLSFPSDPYTPDYDKIIYTKLTIDLEIRLRNFFTVNKYIRQSLISIIHNAYHLCLCFILDLRWLRN